MNSTSWTAAALMSLLFLASGPTTAGQGSAPRSFDDAPSAPEKKSSGPRVFFRNLRDGQTVATEQKILFGLDGMKIRPAGELVDGTGHHHLIIDGKPVPEGQVVPADEKHIHFGKGQEEALVKLSPGAHTLTLQFADGAHRSYGPEMATTIRVRVR